MTKVIESHHDEKKVWQEIMKYLEKEIQIKEKILLYEEIKLKNPEIPRPQKGGRNNAYNVDHLKSKKCFICETNDHVPTLTKGNLLINYFACDKFVNVTK